MNFSDLRSSARARHELTALMTKFAEPFYAGEDNQYFHTAWTHTDLHPFSRGCQDSALQRGCPGRRSVLSFVFRSTPIQKNQALPLRSSMLGIRRREFITLLGGAATAWPLVARAQQPERMRRIGMLLPATAEDTDFQTLIAA